MNNEQRKCMKATNCNMLEDGYQHKTATKRSEIHKITCVPIPNACNSNYSDELQQTRNKNTATSKQQLI
jgi:hypothetical protein